MLDQEFQDEVGFLLLKPDDPLYELGVEENSFLARDRVDAHDWVDTGDGVFAD